MRKLFKKSLACCLAAALSLSCFLGALSVNAETTVTGSISIAAIEDITTSDSSQNIAAKVTVDVNDPDTSDSVTPTIHAAMLNVSLPDGWAIASVSDLPAQDNESGFGGFVDDSENFDLTNGKIILEYNGSDDTYGYGFSSVTFTLNITVPANVPVSSDSVSYAISISGVGDVYAADWNENTATLESATATVNVKQAEPECSHENTEFYYDDDHEIVAAEGSLADGETAKGKIYFKCTGCGEIIEEEVSYYYYYTTGTQNATLKSEILFNFKAQPKHLNMQGTFQDAYFVLDMQKETGLVRNVTNYADATYEDGTKPYYVVSMGIAAKEMTTAMVSTVYVKYNDQWWSGYQFNKKFVDFVNERFVATDGTDEEKTMFADMLTFGAAAQTHFNFNVNDLATDYLGEYSSYVTTTEPTIEDKSVNGLLNATVYDHVGYNTYGLNLGSIIKINLGFRTDFYTGEEPLGELTAVCTYTDNDGNLQSKTYTSEEYEPVTGKTNRYQFSYDGIAAKDMRKIVTCTINNESGAIGYDLQTSIESVTRLLIDETDSETLKATLVAMIKYGDSANAYFAS